LVAAERFIAKCSGNRLTTLEWQCELFKDVLLEALLEDADSYRRKVTTKACTSYLHKTTDRSIPTGTFLTRND
jgi:hypothetical protein